MVLKLPRELRSGFLAFRHMVTRGESFRYSGLAEGQSPETLVIACCDSRVDPMTIFQASPGELFVVRNIANLVPPFEREGRYHGTSAALEYAVLALKVKNIIVLGHAHCGGIAASLNPEAASGLTSFLAPWVELTALARGEVMDQGADDPPEKRQRELELHSIRHSLHNLMTFDFVAEAVEERRLTLHGAWFSIFDASLYWMSPENREFLLVEPIDDIG